uniref:HNH nuclease domain-containing protein n=1 Tax=Florenciella sp. virus SA2 TaxID=3240092 RepID=A0AB39J6U3_9VIRU
MKILNIFVASLANYKNSYHYTFYKNINNIYQINGSYSILNYNKYADPLKYGTKARRKVKYSYHKKGTIEDHHIIPKEFEKHKLLKEINFHVCCSNNIYIMPPVGRMIHNETIYHTNHRLYNEYVKEHLNNILVKNKDKDSKKYEFILFFNNLRALLDKNDDYLSTLFKY